MSDVQTEAMQSNSNQLDLAFHALSDRTRRAVVSRLADGEAPVSLLAEPFEMALPSFAQHLRVLEDAGLITTEKRGRRRWCRLAQPRLDEAAHWLENERRRCTDRLDRLEAYLDKSEADKA